MRFWFTIAALLASLALAAPAAAGVKAIDVTKQANIGGRTVQPNVRPMERNTRFVQSPREMGRWEGRQSSLSGQRSAIQPSETRAKRVIVSERRSPTMAAQPGMASQNGRRVGGEAYNRVAEGKMVKKYQTPPREMAVIEDVSTDQRATQADINRFSNPSTPGNDQGIPSKPAGGQVKPRFSR
jgi:hypothetical protein